ncbi:hypothetical protein HPB50_007992 [Hyalomma asiaticum]|uniref:Uncharacterized protein n=1 Tax=Hyalomma asiaticum TaxID=266040 RepID=A0ACB7RVB7_HYAAI|nr:hypothetical protein HPB50_007992 [Hyalomma asiaticum]
MSREWPRSASSERPQPTPQASGRGLSGPAARSLPSPGPWWALPPWLGDQGHLRVDQQVRSSQARTAPAVRPGQDVVGAATMELLVRGQSQGRQGYHPFPRDGHQAKPACKTPQKLQDLCRRAIIKDATLRRLKDSDLPTLPPLIRHDLTILSTQDFVEIESAPFKDMFDFHMYHRAPTYRVRCTVDGGEYMATHAGTCNSVQHNSEAFWQWVELAHPNLMCVYALALDADTSNVFLIMEIPDATLKRLEIILACKGLCFPEYFLWKVAEQLSSVIMYVEERQLSFGRFDLKNVYLVGDRLHLDNKLTWKSCVDASPIRNRVQSIFLGDMVNIGGHYELQANSPSSASLMCLGFVLTRLASIALTDRRTSSTFTGMSGLETSFKINGDVLFFDGFRPAVPQGPTTYSSDLFDLLVSLHSTNLPPLSAIHAKAVEMMALIMAKERVATQGVGDEESDLRLNERNLPGPSGSAARSLPSSGPWWAPLPRLGDQGPIREDQLVSSSQARTASAVRPGQGVVGAATMELLVHELGQGIDTSTTRFPKTATRLSRRARRRKSCKTCVAELSSRMRCTAAPQGQ